jgi:iron complex outermembrane receptor protein
LQSTLDGALGTHASLAPGALSTRYKILDTHVIVTGEKLQINVWNWHSSDAGVGVGAAQALDPNGRDDSDLWMADLTYHLNLGGTDWDNSIRLGYLHYDELAYFNIFPAGTVLPIGGDGNIDFAAPAGIVQFPDGLLGNPGGLAKDTQLDLISIFSGWDSHRLRFAIGARHRSLEPNESKNFGPGVIDGSVPVINGELTNVSNTPYVFLPDSSRNIRYLSVQDEWQIVTDLALTTGLRYDDYSDFGSTTNPRVALVWAATEALTTKLLYGSAFRAPSFSELGFKNNPVSLGNPNLNPEKIDTVELSFNYKVNDNLQSTLTLFNYKAKDMIEYLPDQSTTTKTAQNARTQDGKGFEWEVNWKPLPKLRLSSSYSMQQSKDRKTKTDVPDAPGDQVKLNANWEFYSNWFLNSQVEWVGDRNRAAGDARKPVDDYTLVNFTLRRNNIVPDLDIAFAVQNAMDADAREPSSGVIAEDYPLESRSAWIELTYSFR